MLPSLVERIVSVLGDGQHAVDGQLLTALAQGLADRLVERNLEPPRNIAGHVVVGKLIGVHRDHIDAGIGQFAAKVVWAEEVFQDVVGVAAKPQHREHRRHLGPRGRRLGPGQPASRQREPGAKCCAGAQEPAPRNRLMLAAVVEHGFRSSLRLDGGDTPLGTWRLLWFDGGGSVAKQMRKNLFLPGVVRSMRREPAGR